MKLDYGASTCGFKHYNCTDNVEHRATRYFLGVTPTQALYRETSLLPSTYRRWGNILRFWNRLPHIPANRLTRKVFDHNFNLCHSNWSSNVKTIMECFGQSNTFNSKSTIDLVNAERSLFSYYRDKWTNGIQNVPKLRTFKTFKTDSTCENYLTLD